MKNPTRAERFLAALDLEDLKKLASWLGIRWIGCVPVDWISAPEKIRRRILYETRRIALASTLWTMDQEVFKGVTKKS